MKQQFIITIMLVLGSVIMLSSIVRYNSIFKQIVVIDDGKKKRISRFITANIVFMIGFFWTYMYIAFYLSKNMHLNDIFVVAVFFCYAIFVYNVIAIQSILSSVINDSHNFNAVNTLNNTIEAKDPYTKGHSKHVANLSKCIYDHLDSSIQESIDPGLLEYAGLLHDIGKIGISDSVLLKKGGLNESEWEVMRSHTLIGKEILMKNKIFESISAWVYYHHERVDGQGYYGLFDEEIPIEARILAVADCYSAINTDRIYRKGKDYNETIKIMKNVAGTQIDRKIFGVFEIIEQEKIEACRPIE